MTIGTRALTFRAELKDVLEKTKIRAMMKTLLAPENGSETEKMKQLSCIQASAAITSQKQDTMHGQDQYMQRKVQHFICNMEGIGPAEGTDCLAFHRNTGKTIKEGGRLECSFMAHHSDLLLDSAAWHGLKWGFRQCQMHEKLPPFTEHKKLFDIPSCRQVKKCNFLSADCHGDLFTPVCKDHGLADCTDKITHLWRGHSI